MYGYTTNSSVEREIVARQLSVKGSVLKGLEFQNPSACQLINHTLVNQLRVQQKLAEKTLIQVSHYGMQDSKSAFCLAHGNSKSQNHSTSLPHCTGLEDEKGAAVHCEASCPPETTKHFLFGTGVSMKEPHTPVNYIKY